MGVPAGSQCLQMWSVQNLVKLCLSAPHQLPLGREDWLESCSVSCSGCRPAWVPLCLLWCAACVWQSWAQLCRCLLSPLLSVCACLEGLWCCTVCPVLSATRAFLGRQTRPLSTHTAQSTGVVWGISGTLCFWQLGMWGTCKINSSWLVPPCSAVWFVVLLVQAEPH